MVPYKIAILSLFCYLGKGRGGVPWALNNQKKYNLANQGAVIFYRRGEKLWAVHEGYCWALHEMERGSIVFYRGKVQMLGMQFTAVLQEMYKDSRRINKKGINQD